ncbi:hypothetical protein OB13_00490 [Pontibacter sp. HJ8]
MIKQKTGQALKSLVSLNEGPWRWSVGVQAALAMGLITGSFTLFGYQSYGLIASLGGFTALYCASMRRIDRVRILPMIVAGFALVSLLGVLCSVNVWLYIACLIVVAAMACIFTLGASIGAPGPLMFVLVCAVTGHIAAHNDPARSNLNNLAIPLLVALGATLAYLVAIAPLLVPSVRRRENQVSDYPLLNSRFRLDPKARMITFRVIVGVAIGSIVGLGLEADRSYWVIIPAIAVLQVGHNKRNTTIRAFHRILGTILGLFIFFLLYQAEPSGFWIVLIIMLLQFAIEVVVVKNYGLALIFITPVALTIATATRADDFIFSAQERVLDTLIGAGIGLVVFWVDDWFRTRGSKEQV